MNFNLIRREPNFPFLRPYGEPFLRDMEEMTDRFHRFFGTWTSPFETQMLTKTEWVPAVDIQEKNEEYVVKAELPEVDKRDVKVTVEENLLTIQGERKQEKEEKDLKFHRVERSYGTFLRTFTLPEYVDGQKVTADFKDGVLTVHLPKTQRPRTKAIEVPVVS